MNASNLILKLLTSMPRIKPWYIAEKNVHIKVKWVNEVTEIMAEHIKKCSFLKTGRQTDIA